MTTLAPEFQPGGRYGNTAAAIRARAVYAAGFTGKLAADLILRDEIDLQPAREILGFAKICGAVDGIDPQAAAAHAILNGIPVDEVRRNIVQLRAEIDEETHTDTTKPIGAISAATSEIYAHRAAEVDASLAGGTNG